MVKNDTSTRLVRKGSMSLSGGRTTIERKYVFIWRQNDYLKAAVDEIQWIEAAGSYSRIVPQACGDTGREQAEDRQ